MNEKEQEEYLHEYHLEKEKGGLFFPDILFKDAVVSLLVFLVLAGLAYFLGAPLEERANPANTNYIPRPEWYFLFLFQLLKYVPGKLEVIGAIIIPGIVMTLLFLLPLLDRGPKRHLLDRLPVTTLTGAIVAGILVLTVLAVREAPPPSVSSGGDTTAALYAKNCSGCHGESITVEPGANLHNIIAQGNHAGMPAWSGDLTSDQIDALAGFITSPGGSRLFGENCSSCHQVEQLVEASPMDLRQAIENGSEFSPHAGVQVPDWSTSLSLENRSSLLNFLVAPDGQRLFASNCSACHGRSVTFAGSTEELYAVISQGGHELDMPGLKETLTSEQVEQLSKYVVDPASMPQAQVVFQELCSSCHGQRVPQAGSVEAARQIIESGGPHRTMPAWGNVLTSEQMEALVSYTRQSSAGSSVAAGQELFSQYCASCHGSLGEGGANPTRPGDIIAPISSAEYLKTRDDATLTAIISDGQPNFGMSPFASSSGGPLERENIEALVNFIRSWEAKPPVDLPPEVEVSMVSKPPAELYETMCSQCHGSNGQGGVGPGFQEGLSDQEMFDAISTGRASTVMIGWGEILSPQQINQIIELINGFEKATPLPDPDASSLEDVSFSQDVFPILAKECAACHGSMGGWDASSYAAVMKGGNNGPAILPGDPQGSPLIQRLLGTQTTGGVMPPMKSLTQEQIDLIAAWIEAGAMDN